jgi:tRNA(fMet)-specific endonuclease VapC
VILRSQPKVAIPVVVLGEFRYGIDGSRHRRAYEGWLDEHLGDFDLLALTPETTLPYAALRATL